MVSCDNARFSGRNNNCQIFWQNHRRNFIMAEKQIKTVDKGKDFDVELFEKSVSKLEKTGMDKTIIDTMTPEQVIATAKVLCMAENPKTIAQNEAENWGKTKGKAEQNLDGIFGKLGYIAMMQMGKHRVDWGKSSSIQFDGYRLEYGIRFFNPENDIDYQTKVNAYIQACMAELEAEVKRCSKGINRYADYKMQDEKNSPALTFGMAQHDPDNKNSLRATITVKKVLTD